MNTDTMSEEDFDRQYDVARAEKLDRIEGKKQNQMCPHRVAALALRDRLCGTIAETPENRAGSLWRGADVVTRRFLVMAALPIDEAEVPAFVRRPWESYTADEKIHIGSTARFLAADLNKIAWGLR